MIAVWIFIIVMALVYLTLAYLFIRKHDREQTARDTIVDKAIADSMELGRKNAIQLEELETMFNNFTLRIEHHE